MLGRWKVTLTNAWFLDEGTIQHGEAVFEWQDDAFIVMRGDLEGERTWNFVFGHSDAGEHYTALYHDPRGTCRVFDFTFDGTTWELMRRDPDFHQRWTGVVSDDGNRMDTHPDASEDEGKTWRKDFDLAFERIS